MSVIINPGSSGGGPFQPLDADLTSIAALTGTGFAARIAANTWALRTLQAGANISISNPAGVGGDPTIAVSPQGSGSGLDADTVDGLHAAAFQPVDADLTALAGLTTTGILVRTGAGTAATRSLVQPAAGLTIANNDGVAGDPTFALANDLGALEALAGTGIAVRSAADTWVQRSIAVTDSASVDFTITDGNGVAGNPTITAAVLPAGVDHNSLANLTVGDPHTQYTKLAGRAGTANDTTLSTTGNGTLSGSTAAMGNLNLNATSNSAPGDVRFNESITSISTIAAFACVEANGLSIAGNGAVVLGLVIGGSQQVGHSAWTVTGDHPLVLGLDFSPRLQTASSVTKTIDLIEAHRSDPEFMVGSSSTLTITEYNILSDVTRYDRLSAGSGTLTITAASAVKSQPSIQAGATIGTRRGMYFAAPQAGGGTTQTAIGLEVEDMTTSSLLAAVRSTIVAGAHNYFLRSTGDAKSVVKGSLRLGDTTDPTEILEVAGKAVVTTSITAGTTTAGAEALNVTGNGTLTGNVTGAGSSHLFGTQGTTCTLQVGRGTTGTDNGTLTIDAGNGGGIPALKLQQNVTDVGIIRVDGAGLGIMQFGTAGAIYQFYSDATFTTNGLAINTGKISRYQNIATIGNGVPAQFATIDLTAQGAAIGSSLLYAVPAARGGLYRISYVATVTRAATTSSTLGGAGLGVQIDYTDNDTGVAKLTPAGAAVAAGTNTSLSTPTNAANTVAAVISGCIVVSAQASSNINYRIGYTSAGATTMQYNLHIRIEAL